MHVKIIGESDTAFIVVGDYILPLDQISITRKHINWDDNPGLTVTLWNEDIILQGNDAKDFWEFFQEQW